MDRLFRAGIHKQGVTLSTTATRDRIPLSLRKNKVALIKAIKFEYGTIPTGTTAEYSMSLLNNEDLAPSTEDASINNANCIASFIWQWFSGTSSFSQIDPGSFITLPPPYFPVISDLQLVLFASGTAAGIDYSCELWYEQKDISMEEWLRIVAKQ